MGHDRGTVIGNDDDLKAVVQGATGWRPAASALRKRPDVAVAATRIAAIRANLGRFIAVLWKGCART